jgi:hypothetical protein
MDPRLAEILPAESNPLKLQRAVHLYPTQPDPDSLWFVFLTSVTRTSPASLPAQTSLQRGLIDFLARGGSWNGGGFFMLPEDMLAPREGAYRERFEALCREVPGLRDIPAGGRA